MAQALSRAADSEILKRNRRLTGRLGKYSYQIVTEGGKSLYTVSDGTRSTVQTILWAVGQGRGAQSYLYKQNGVFHEARVSYFSQIGNLDLTLGHPHAEPPGLDEATGRPLTDFDVAKCINCHSTGAQPESGLELTYMTPGITCENCHGPGAQHVAAVRSGKTNDLRIFNPGRLKTEDLIYNFCGSCHRNAFDVASNGASGVTTIRFEPYRLVLSRCYNPRDRRISCLACHNPHERMQQEAAFYDAKCLDCHDGPNRPASAGRVIAPRCSIAIKNCVTCHMPKHELPGDHFKFADHDIRVVRPDERFPG